MNEIIEKLPYDHMIGKIVTALVSIFLLITLVRFTQHTFNRHIKESENRYLVKKSTTFVEYVLGILVIAIIFIDRLGD